MIFHVQFGAYIEAENTDDLWAKVGPISEQLDALDAEGDSAYEMLEAAETIDEMLPNPIKPSS